MKLITQAGNNLTHDILEAFSSHKVVAWALLNSLRKILFNLSVALEGKASLASFTFQVSSEICFRYYDLW